MELRQQVWKAFFYISGIYQEEQFDEEITLETLWDPEDPLTIALIQLYSMDTFI